MQLIAAAERERRGLYGGAVGYLGYDGNLDTAITIRSAVLKDGLAHVHTGAGIVAGASPRRSSRRPSTRRRPSGGRSSWPGWARPAVAAPGRPTARAPTDPMAATGPTKPDASRPTPPPRPGAAMILVIDNYDSFTFNLVQALQAAGAEVRVVRNDAIDRAGLEALATDPASDLSGIVISPGPGNPGTAGVSVAAVEVAAAHDVPLLGVCLGMQSMAAAFGGSIVRAPTLVHGEASEVSHDGLGLLAECRRAFAAPGIIRLCVDPGAAARAASSRR